MANDLTIRQFAQLVLGKVETPLHLGDFLTAYKSKFMALGPTMAELSKSQAFMFVAMISRGSVMNFFGSTPSQVQYSIAQMKTALAAVEGDAPYWTGWASCWLSGNQAAGAGNSEPGYATLVSKLKSVGASIFYLSPPTQLPSYDPDLGPGTMQAWSVIGILGTFGALANLDAKILPFWPGGANGWNADDWQTISDFANGGDALLLAPAQLIPAIWLAAQGQVTNLPYANMILLSGR